MKNKFRSEKFDLYAGHYRYHRILYIYWTCEHAASKTNKSINKIEKT